MNGPARRRAAIAFRAARLFRRPSVTVGGEWGRFRGYADDETMLRHYGRVGTWAAGAVAVLASTARKIAADGGPAPLLLDVGAGLGLVSAGVVHQCGARALALESDPATFAYLRHNLAVNRLGDRVTARCLAVGAPTAAGCGVRMARTPGNGGDSRVVAETDSGGTPLVCLDDLCRDYADTPLLLKVDVQGYEPMVIAGGGETLRRARLAVVEFWPEGLRQMGHDPAAFATRLLGGVRRAAVMADEHRLQSVAWQAPDEVLSTLAGVSADGGPERQVELLLEGTA